MVIAELVAKLGLQLDPAEWGRGDDLISGVKGALVGLLAALGLNEIRGMIESVIDLGGELNDTSASIGVAVEDLQELRYAASLAGVSAGELDGAIRKYARGLEEAKKGKGPVADAFRDLKISMDEIKEGGIADNLEVIADRFAKMPDGPKKTAAAMDLFGRSGAQLVPFLNEGSDGVAALRREAHELGVVLSEDTVGSLDDVGDNIDRTKAALQGVKLSIVSALLPSIKEMVDGLLAWVKANKEVIAQAVNVVVQAAIIAFQALAVAIDGAVAIVNWFREGSDLAKAVLVGIAYVITAAVVPALWAMVTGWAAALAPILAVVAVVAAVTLVLMDLWKSFTTGKGVAATAWKWITDKARAFWNFIKSIPGRILDAFKALGRGIIDSLAAAFDFVISKARQAAGLIWDEIKSVPIIGQAAAGVEWAAGKLANLDSPVGSLNDQVNSMIGTPAASSNSVSVSNQFTITQQPGENAESLAKRIAEHDASSRRSAFDALRGGIS